MQPEEAKKPVIELDGLTVQFGSRTILSDLKASVSGRAIGLLGPNGAGKTTLLHTLLGFHEPKRGAARIFGHDVTTEGREARRLLGYMPERDAFIAGISGVRFVRLMAEMSGLPSEEALERAHEAFFYVGLGEARYRNVETYSYGMKQLAKFAQAIVHGPRLLLLDEPTNGLDPPARARMLRLIRQVRDSGSAHVIISSHLLKDVEDCCDEVLVLKEGRIATYCNLEAERRTNRKFLLVETRGADRAAFAQAVEKLGAECALAGERRIKVVLPAEVEVQSLFEIAAEQEIQIRRLDYKRDSLQEIFLRAMEA
ncbi:MAG TPA: ABC transporter ATP-binding protein [Thermoanaerobaculia bacterium]|nr:ABC transporter ATP-binding protein [Thermoanaerobaculia bacterium]